ncbi:B12-binding domain-containing radical SAM protein [Patescibacteria group bacterium]|nr:B12-binding domain-containing radical SAM protein [Patescibacteria group bacterium]MBU4458377.1 B12-binding domain-containing radical SAM protein [Patescibacteria group bacterium]MCG2695868.1 B12-binding domain-containing radical SAM protein [Candidatus Portnoybacteria bacterium]
MKILLIKPKSFFSAKGAGPPLSLMYIASFLKQGGHQVILRDFMVFKGDMKEELEKLIKEENIKIAGVTCNSHERFESFDVIKLLKKIDSNIITILGGPHPTICPQETIKNLPELDILVTNDGENAMRVIIDCLNSKKDFENIGGIIYRTRQGAIKENHVGRIVVNLDEYPFPDFNLINMDDYQLTVPIKGKPMSVPIISSRGCPFNCGFCAAKETNYGRIRFRSIDNIIEELKILLPKFPGYHIFIYDDHFLVNKDRILEFCQKVKKENLKFKWACYGRVDSIDEEIVTAIKEVGCVMISFGIESGSKKMLKKMNKLILPNQIIKAVKIVKKHGISARGSFIFNYPDENIFDVIKTFWLIFRLKLTPEEFAIGPYTVLYPGTQLFADYKNKCLPENFNWNKKYENLPNYKEVPIYQPIFFSLRLWFIHFLRKIHKAFNILKSKL